MSERATAWALGHSDTEGSLRLVLTVLAFNADTKGCGRMRERTIARQATIPSEQVETALDLLTRRNRVEYVRPGKRQRFDYRIQIPADYRPELIPPFRKRVALDRDSLKSWVNHAADPR